MRWRQSLLSATVLLAVTSCEGRSPVSGEVRYPDGAPLEVGQVVFESAKLKSGSACDIAPDGTFRLLEPLPSGEYVVYVAEARKLLNPATAKFGPVLVHEKFTTPERSPLRAEVGAGPIHLTVEPPPAAK